jgi:hypothetical protein
MIDYDEFNELMTLVDDLKAKIGEAMVLADDAESMLDNLIVQIKDDDSLADNTKDWLEETATNMKGAIETVSGELFQTDDYMDTVQDDAAKMFNKVYDEDEA